MENSPPENPKELLESYAKAFTELEVTLQQEANPYDALKWISSAVTDLLAMESRGIAEATPLIRWIFFKAIIIVTNRQQYDKAGIYKVHDFLKQSLQFSAGRLESDNEYSSVIVLITDYELNFYRTYWRTSMPTEDGGHIYDDIMQFCHKSSIVPSLKRKMFDPSMGCSLKAILDLSSFLYRIADYSKPPIRDEILSNMEDIPKRILSMSDAEMKNDDKNLFMNICSLYERFLNFKGTESPKTSRCHFQVMLGIKLIKTPFLEKRIHGMFLINDLIEAILKFMSTATEQENNTDSASRDQNILLFTSKQFTESICSILLENSVIELLFGEKKHAELIKRSFPLLKYLAALKSLSYSNLHLIWECCVVSHVSLKTAIILILSDLSDLLDLKQSIDLLKIATSQPLEAYDTHLLEFVRDQTHSFSIKYQSLLGDSLFVSNLPKNPGVHLIWALIQDNSSVSSESSLFAYNCLEQLLGQVTFSSLRSDYANKCIENISTNHCADLSIKLLTSLITASMQQSDSQMACDENARVLLGNQVVHLVNLVCDDCARYKSIVQRTIKERCIDTDFNKYTIVGKLTHKERIESSLRLLQTLMTYVQLPLLERNIDTIWESLIE